MKKLLWPSMDVLHEKCLKWFQDRGEAVYMPGTSVSFGRKKKDVNVVLMGRYLEQLSECSSWPFESVKLWVLSRAAKNSLVKFSGISPSSISVIPRYELFPMASVLQPFPDPNKPWSLVFSGRMTRDKGFLLYLKLASHLQKKGYPVTPVIFGVKNIQKTSESKEITDLLKQLKWSIPPVMWINLSQSEWIQRPVHHPVLFNFTSYIKDDFGVSPAQAQAAGWPMLLSEWGGNLDIVGSNVRFIAHGLALPKLADTILKKMGETDTRPQSISATQIPSSHQVKDLKLAISKLKKVGIASNKEWPVSVIKTNHPFYLSTPEFILDKYEVPWRIQNEEKFIHLENEFLSLAKTLKHKEPEANDVTFKLRAQWYKSYGKFNSVAENKRQEKYLKAVRWLGKKTLGLKDANSLHAKVTGGASATRFRNRKVFLKDPQGNVCDQCVDPRFIASLVEAGSRLDSFGDHGIRKAIWIHFFVLVVHPFHDGNGRVARLLERSQLASLGVVFGPLWNPEVAVHWDLPGYTKAIHDAQKTGQFDPFLEFILKTYNSIAKGLILKG